MNLPFYLVLLIMTTVISSKDNSEDLYKLLGVPKDASVKEIRKAFKTLAVKMHPDKNKDDKEADAKFIKITQAYETLKDPETRKSYDIYGETGTTKGDRPQYHSYSYYQNEFGIYDDDPLIVTLSKADYELNVLDRNQAWFINFYSPHCHHCHVLAPTWRQLAADLEGVVRIGAVNCEEDWALCHQLTIRAYPTLLYYEKEAHLYEGEQYHASKNLEDLKNFILSRLSVTSKILGRNEWLENKDRNWLLILCAEDNINCPEKETILKLTAILQGLMPVGIITDLKTCNEISDNYKQVPIVLWQYNEEDSITTINPIEGSDTKEIVDAILNLLPNPELIDDDKFKIIRDKLRNGETKPWLLCFYLGTAIELNLQLKRLPTLISNINIGLIHCGKNSGLCASLHVSHYPAWGILKEGGAFELHHGRDVLHEVAAFARDSSKSTNLHALSPADFGLLRKSDELWFIDWYAPWCPPCRKLMPEMRKASQHFTSDRVKFGTVDCTLHSGLCAQEGIRSYPTTIFYNGSKHNHFHGVLSEGGIVDFVEDMLNPAVIALDSSNFGLLMRKPADEMWFVDYFAPWCGPCQRLSPHFRTVAKEMKEYKNIKIASVDCVENADLCAAQNIRSYPTLWLYPLGSKGLNSIAIYNGHKEVLAMKSWLFGFLPSKVKALSSEDFKKQVLKRSSSLPWLIDFYAPWCGHCVHFEPQFRIVGDKLEGISNVGKVDCDFERQLCRDLRVASYPTLILYLSANNFYQINSQDPESIVNQVIRLIETKSHYSHDEL